MLRGSPLCILFLFSTANKTVAFPFRLGADRVNLVDYLAFNVDEVDK